MQFSYGATLGLGVVVEHLGSVTYLVQVESGVFWRRHVDHLRPAASGPNSQNPHTVPVLPNLTEQTDYASIGGTDFDAEQQPPPGPEPPSAERRYPVRETRRPPARYTDESH